MKTVFYILSILGTLFLAGLKGASKAMKNVDTSTFKNVNISGTSKGLKYPLRDVMYNENEFQYHNNENIINANDLTINWEEAENKKDSLYSAIFTLDGLPYTGYAEYYKYYENDSSSYYLLEFNQGYIQSIDS